MWVIVPLTSNIIILQFLMSKCMNVLKLISSKNACMLVIMPLHHATSPCHIIMPCHHDTSACHVIMPYQHAMSSCHISMPCSMPCHHATCHLVIGPYCMDTMCHPLSGATSSCLYSTDATCHLVSGATWHLFLPNLPVDLIEQNAITFSYGVRLRWNERRWNRIDEPFYLVLVLLRLEDFKILPSWILLDQLRPQLLEETTHLNDEW